MPVGKPTKFTPEILREICEGLEQGTPLAVILRDMRENMGDDAPAYGTVMEWQRTDSDISEHIARARDTGHDIIAQRARETARGRGETSGDIQRDKLIIETDLKLLAKWNRRYAEKHVVSGDAENPVAMTFTLDLGGSADESD